MRVVILTCQRLPTRTCARLARLTGTGTAYITDSLGHDRRGYPGTWQQWVEVGVNYAQGQTQADVLQAAAALGQDILYRVSRARSGDRARLFTRAGERRI